MSDAFLSSAIMLLALALFVSDRLRPDAVALIILLLAWATGLVSLEEALAGFGSPAVIIVAAVLVVGRAVEYTGAAQAMTGLFVPRSRFVTLRIGGVLLMGALLSAFMNNIAALAITMPIALNVAREHGLPNGAVLMPLAFATILGGMTTLIGTPANLIISSIREDTVGAPFGMFDMTPVGGALALAGIVYLTVIGWRLAPHRQGEEEPGPAHRVLVFELGLPIAATLGQMRVGQMRARLREAGAVLLAVLRDGQRAKIEADALLYHDDRLLVMSRDYPWKVAEGADLFAEVAGERPDSVFSHVTVIHGSSLVGQDYGAIGARTGGAVELIAAGPRAARLRRPLQTTLNEAGDQHYLRGEPAALKADLARLSALWGGGRSRFGGPFLAGPEFSAVDAFYAPIVFRVRTYGLDVGPVARGWGDHMLDHPAMREWEAAALAETWREESHEAEVGAAGRIIEDHRAS